MYHVVLAQELSKQAAAVEDSTGSISGRKISVLNYAPGPLDTDMQKEIRYKVGLCGETN